MKDAYYFAHDSNAKDDPKCVMLIEQLGLEGYGIFWILIETLRDQPDYKYPIALIPALARRYNTTGEKMKTVVGGYGLFETENEEFFYSDSLNRRMESVDNYRESQRKKALKRWGDAAALPEQSQGNADPMPVKESKVKESKGNKKKENKNTYAEFVQMTEKEYQSLIERVGEAGAKRCVEILDNYKGANGKKYASDYRAILNWVIERYRQEKPLPATPPKADPSKFDFGENL